MIKRGIRNELARIDKSKANIELWKFFSNTYFAPSWISIKKYNQNILEINNLWSYFSYKILSKLLLREHEFYSKTISLSKSVYEKLSGIYLRVGQFNYFDNRDQGEVIEEEGIDEKSNKKYVKVKATIKEGTESFRSITVYENGIIQESEWNVCSSLIRTRTIFENEERVHSFKNKDTNLDN